MGTREVSLPKQQSVKLYEKGYLTGARVVFPVAIFLSHIDLYTRMHRLP